MFARYPFMPRGRRSRRAGRAVQAARARQLLNSGPRIVSVEQVSRSFVRLTVQPQSIEVQSTVVQSTVVQSTEVQSTEVQSTEVQSTEIQPGPGSGDSESPSSPSASPNQPRVVFDQSTHRPAYWTSIAREYKLEEFERTRPNHPPGGIIPFHDPRYGYYSEEYFRRTGFDGYPPFEAKRLEKRGIAWGDLWGP